MFAKDALATAVAVLSLLQPALCATADQWASKSIYQIMTDRFALTNGSSPECDYMKYCGGTWRGIINKLDYIQGMGFSAIQISPVVKNLANHTGHGDAFHGYWPVDLYQLNEHFGTAQDLKDLSKALHDRDMLLMVDVVINNMAVAINGVMTPETVIDYKQFNPFNDQSYYHPWCNLTTYFDPEIFQPCWLSSEAVASPDLNTTSPVVSDMMNTWIKQLVSNYTIDGLRIDAAKHVDDDFLKSFVKASGVYTMGEVFNQDRELMCRYATMVDGLANFATYFPLMDAVNKGDFTWLGYQVKDIREKCGGNITHLVTFSENHDLPRFASINDRVPAAHNVVAFTILAEGIPSMYQLQEHHALGDRSPLNRAPVWEYGYNNTAPFYNLTAHLNTLRTHAINSSPLYISTDAEMLHLSKGLYITRKGSIDSNTQIVAAYFNSAAIQETISGPGNGTKTFRFQGGFSGNKDVVEVLTCNQTKTDTDGYLSFEVDEEPKAWVTADMLEGSGLCGRKYVKKVQQAAKPANGTGTAGGEGASDDKDNKDGKEGEKKKSDAVTIAGSRAGWMMGCLSVVAGFVLFAL